MNRMTFHDLSTPQEIGTRRSLTATVGRMPAWVFRLGQLPPIPLEALPMPTDDGSGLND